MPFSDLRRAARTTLAHLGRAGVLASLVFSGLALRTNVSVADGPSENSRGEGMLPIVVPALPSIPTRTATPPRTATRTPFASYAATATPQFGDPSATSALVPPTTTPSAASTSAPKPTAAPRSGGGGGGSSRSPSRTPSPTTVVHPPPKTTFVPAPPPRPQPITPAPETPGGPPPQFVLGFALLKDQMGSIMGEPVEVEQGNSDTCDTQQETTTGLAYWRCGSNLVSFAAYPDGLAHWAAVPQGLLEWTGGVDPPPNAPVIRSLVPDGSPSRPSTACMAAVQVPTLDCSVDDWVSALGTLVETGETNAFHFSVPASGAGVVANLMDLPADYDLYLVDAFGAILSQSIEEGTTPEHIGTTVPGGEYYLYVHSDPSRAVDAYNPYRLELSFSGAAATDTPAATGTLQPGTGT